ncbi:hypothetical protein PTTG_30470, partial [Puccinia triticina 1-1 BBBD Race 1]
MTAEADRLITKKTGTNPGLSDNHIRCVCHKIALIITAGLKAIRTETEGLTKTKKKTLGFVPQLDAITESNNELGGFVSGDEELGDPLEDSDDKDSTIVPLAVPPTQSAKMPQTIAEILAKVDFVIQRITSLSSKRSEFEVWHSKLDDPGPTLIAGYGIRWNIKWQSRDRAYRSRNVINKLIENEKDWQERNGGKSFFDDHEITRGDWEVVKRLNDVLSEFYFITKKMEGNHSSAGMLLVEYQSIIDFLKGRLSSTTNFELKPMFRAMIKKSETYLSEALQCDTILLATTFNPSYRLSIFQIYFPSHHGYAKTLLQQKFNYRKLELAANLESTQPSPPATSQQEPNHHWRPIDDIDLFPAVMDAVVTDELANYLGGKYKYLPSQADQCLVWWK